MKLRDLTIGKLVRVKTLVKSIEFSNAGIETSNNKYPNKSNIVTSNLSYGTSYYCLHLKTNNPGFVGSGKGFFDGLSLGDTSDPEARERTYCARVVSYLSYLTYSKIYDRASYNIHYNHWFSHDLLTGLPPRWSRSPDSKFDIKYVSTVLVGVRFYTGFKELDRENNTKVLKEENIWQRSKDNIFYFHYTDLVPLDRIIKFETIQENDVIISRKTRGIVLEAKTLNKPSFWSSNSLTRKHVVVLNPNRKMRLNPGVDYRIIKNDNTRKVSSLGDEESVLLP